MVQTDRTGDGRPDPDALLAAYRRESGGKLKVFLGAAPGVGKTYAMLQGARRLKADGVDVMIGVVETHGRSETQSLLEGLEVLPRRAVEYRGRTIEEFDIDAALARKPRLIIVDELAHTNAPESRHPKRWQDVRELLDAGIDVWTALNIQHLESLSDVVSRVTGVVVDAAHPDHVKLLESWMKSYKAEELFDANGTLKPELAELAPKGARRMGANPHANGGILLRDLQMPDFRDHAVHVAAPGAVTGQDTMVLGKFLRDVTRLNEDKHNFRIFGPDETLSNLLGDVFEVTNRQWDARKVEDDEFLRASGPRVGLHAQRASMRGMARRLSADGPTWPLQQL